MGTSVLPIKRVFHPLPRAIKLAAEQNLLRDHRAGLINASSLKELDIPQRLIYIQEAKRLLRSTGENHLPCHPDTQHICLLKGS